MGGLGDSGAVSGRSEATTAWCAVNRDLRSATFEQRQPRQEHNQE